MTIRRTAALVGAVLGLIAGVMASASTDAHALVTVSPALQTQINNNNVQGMVRGFGAVPVQGGNATTVQTWTSQLSKSAATRDRAAAQLAAETTNLTSKAGFLSKLRFLSNIALAEGSFQLGWKIGTGLNAKFLHFDTMGSNHVGPIVYSNLHMHYYPVTVAGGGEPNSVAASSVESPPGYWAFESSPYGEKELGSQDFPTRNIAPWHNFIEMRDSTKTAVETNGFGAVNNCSGTGNPAFNCWIRARASDQEMEALIRNQSTLPQPYTTQPFDYDTGTTGITDPGVASTTTTINDQLANHPADYPTLLPWLNWKAGDPATPLDPTTPTVPDCFGVPRTTCNGRLMATDLKMTVKVLAEQDPRVSPGQVVFTIPQAGSRMDPGHDVEAVINPVYNDKNDDGCARSVPNFRDPNPGIGWLPGLAMYDLVPSPSQWTLENQFPAYDDVAHNMDFTALLHWGRARPWGNVTTLWEGWGFRHIWAQHGWSVADQADTAEALTHTPYSTEDRDPLRNDFYLLTYQGIPYAGASGELCVRIVKTSFGPGTPFEQEHHLEMGIVDSYAHRVQ